jgi:hypothetical protein
MLSEKLLKVIGVDTFASENGYRRRNPLLNPTQSF